jgi:tetratricopeptide (TPR) repeat protein
MPAVVLLLAVAGCLRYEPKADEQSRQIDVPEQVAFDKLWDYSDPAASEAAFRQLLPAAEQAGEPSYLLELQTQIARAQGLQRRFDDAHATLDRVEARLNHRLPTARVRYRLERGRVYNSSGHPDRARPLFLDAWKQAREAGLDGFAVDAAHMMGIIEASEQALNWNLKALELAESSDDRAARAWLGSLYNNIGWTYHQMGDDPRALEVFEQALLWFEQRGKPEPIRIARWSVARIQRALGRVEEALSTQQALLRELEASGGQDGYVYEELAECRLALGDTAAAKPLFARAYELLAQDAWLQEREPERLTRLKRLGGL